MFLYVECESEVAERIVADGFSAVSWPVARDDPTTAEVPFAVKDFPATELPIVLRIKAPDVGVAERLMTQFSNSEEWLAHTGIWEGPLPRFRLSVTEADRYLPTLTALTNDGDELPLEAVNR